MARGKITQLLDLDKSWGASHVGMAAAGSGDFVRTLANKLAELISVKDFGAIGDGSYHPVSEWYTHGFAHYRGYDSLAGVQSDYPHVKAATDSIDWAAIQKTFDVCTGTALTVPDGVYVITDTLYLNPATMILGDGVGDNWGVTSLQKGARIKTYGAGVPRIWTDVGLPATPAGTLVDAPITVALAITGSACFLSNFCVEGGSLENGSDAWDVGILNCGVRRTILDRIDTSGTFKNSGCRVDATWSNTNTALYNLHKNTYGREVVSDQAANEFTHQNCWLRGGNWGLYVKGTDRDDTSANVWSPGGVSDLVGMGSRIDNTPIGTRPNFPEDSGGYFRDLHNDFQNRRHYNCRIGSQSGYGIFLDRGRYDEFYGFYGETRPDRCVTSLVTKTVDTLGTVILAANNGSEWGGTSGENPTTRRVYLTDSARIDVLKEKIRIGATLTTATGSMVLSGVGYDTTASRAYLMVDSITGTITAGQSITQAAGQTTANGGYYATDRSGAVISTGQTGFKVVGGLNAFFGPTTHARYIRSAGMVSTKAYHIVQASDEVSINADTSQVNLWINRYSFVAGTVYRLRFLGTSLDSYQNADLGSTARRWGTVFANTGTINTSDARVKTAVRPLTEAELNAAKALSREIGMYQFLASVELKGDGAREHCGMTVQRAIEVMESFGLNAFDYSFICYNQWDDEWEEVKNEEGEVVERVKTCEAGDMYSFRMDGFLAFIARGMDARLAELENKNS